MAAEYVQRLGERIQERRKELDMTQLELALALPGKVGADQVSRWERGIHKPEDDTLEEIATVLKVSVAYFLAPAGNGADTPAPFGDSDLATPAARDMITAMFESIEQRVITQLAEHSRKVEAQLAEQSRVLAEIKTLLGKDTKAADRIEAATESLGGAAERLDAHLAQIQAPQTVQAPRSAPPRKRAAKRKTAPKRSPQA